MVTGIPDGIEETVLMFLESVSKGGGEIEFSYYNRKEKSIFVRFEDNNG